MSHDLPVRIRHAARALILDEQDRLLLLRIVAPRPGRAEPWDVWLTPGGGLEPGEDPLAAAERELWEETGLRAALRGPVWRRDFEAQGEDLLRITRETYFLGRVRDPVVAPGALTVEEEATLTEHRWWALPEILASPARIAPRDLRLHLPALIAGELPETPVLLAR